MKDYEPRGSFQPAEHVGIVKRPTNGSIYPGFYRHTQWNVTYLVQVYFPGFCSCTLASCMHLNSEFTLSSLENLSL